MKNIDKMGLIDKMHITTERGSFHKIKGEAFGALNPQLQRVLLLDGIDAGMYIFVPHDADLKYDEKNMFFELDKKDKIKNGASEELLSDLKLLKDIKCKVFTEKQIDQFLKADMDGDKEEENRVFAEAQEKIFTEDIIKALRADILIKELVLTKQLRDNIIERRKSNNRKLERENVRQNIESYEMVMSAPIRPQIKKMPEIKHIRPWPTTIPGIKRLKPWEMEPDIIPNRKKHKPVRRGREREFPNIPRIAPEITPFEPEIPERPNEFPEFDPPKMPERPNEYPNFPLRPKPFRVYPSDIPQKEPKVKPLVAPEITPKWPHNEPEEEGPKSPDFEPMMER